MPRRTLTILLLAGFLLTGLGLADILHVSKHHTAHQADSENCQICHLLMVAATAIFVVVVFVLCRLGDEPLLRPVFDRLIPCRKEIHSLSPRAPPLH